MAQQQFQSSLKQAMKAKKITGKMLADKFNAQPSAVSNWHKRGVPANLVGAVCKLLDVEPHEISPLHEEGTAQAFFRDGEEQAIGFDVDDRAMHPEFQKGDSVIADELRKPEPGQYVAAEYRGTLIVRRYSLATGKPTLLPIAVEYPEIKSGFKLRGVIVSHTRKLFY